MPLEHLLDATVPAVTVEGFGFDPGRGELWFVGETAEAVLLELDARRRELAAEVAELEREAKVAALGCGGRPSRGPPRPRLPTRQVAHLRGAHALDPDVLRRLARGADRLDETLLAAATIATRLEEPLRARAESGSDRAGALGSELARVGALEHEARREAARANERAAAAELLRARLGGEGQIRMLQVDEADRAEVEREARELADEAERLADAATALADTARSAGSAQPRRVRGGRPTSTPICFGACSRAPSAWTRHSVPQPRRRHASRLRSARGSTRVRAARASWARSCASSGPARSS